ncbi:MAG: glutamine--fructose-6-phosphate transaminase (isomerizing) [Alphaproteobacteria bacterium]|nr:glutamine--fructose-6-phosphate transaminase (isomerizing) [Alphaproteobacteria bacterium]
MCGIMGVVAKRPVSQLLLDGLKKLEYRGYDSAGVATLVNGNIERRRAEGKLEKLGDLIKERPLPGTVGIGHTRWATHGKPSEQNAHPHATNLVALVHNGIIENYQELKQELEKEGYHFNSETDTETIAVLLTRSLEQQKTPEQAVAEALPRLKGAFSLAILFGHRDEMLIGVRRGSPLVVGYGQGEMYLGSDAIALASLTNKVTYLEDDDWVVLTPKGAQFYNRGKLVSRVVKQTAFSGELIGKGEFRHYMLKEIHEQPSVVGNLLKHYLQPQTRLPHFPSLAGQVDWNKIQRLNIVGCGTAYLSGMVAKYWFEKYAKIACNVDIGSEFRYREGCFIAGEATLGISQSGETIDTLGAIRYAKQQGQQTISLINVPESAMARESDVVVTTMAGPEIGVASTKAFTAQLTVLACLVIDAALKRHQLDVKTAQQLTAELLETPAILAQLLGKQDMIHKIAEKMTQAKDVLFLGRGVSYPLALEGALKFKELTYIHAEGYAAGEMKHGPIALIDDKVPVVVIAPNDYLLDKTLNNMEVVAARGGQVILISDRQGHERAKVGVHHRLEIPVNTHLINSPIIYALPMQMLAYQAAWLKGNDVDQPRNLAKSVTVE